MSKEVDERIVSMEFDNKNFENNVKTSMSTLDKLKQALRFKNADSGFKSIDNASKKINFNPMGSAIDAINVKFSNLQVVATTALANITNSVVNAGRNMVNQFAIQPITSGFQEYETQMRSIQTILSNTRWEGTNLEQVNGALDELNDYADKTIYNFTEMTRNIGTFTAAGVGLEQSTAAIKGIANLAAVSGSSSQQASTAMYQLSQALAAGKVSLMDWNSVVNAGMGGKVFQDALIRTSELLGTGANQAIETYGTFRESLTKGQWLTTEVLTETLKQISGAYSREELLAQGYTEAQADEIMALAQDAEEAATKVRTFTQLIDTTMEAIGSGWTNTWEILFGDFNEATELFTNINNVIGAAVQQSADARNSLLQGWKDSGGRAALIEGLTNAFNALLSVITPIKEAFSEIFPPVTVETLVNLTNQFKEFTAGLILDETAAAQLKETFKGVFSVVKTAGTILGSVMSGIFSFVKGAAGGFDNLLKFGASLGGFLTNISNAITQTNVFGSVLSVIGEALGKAFSAITEFSSAGLTKFTSMFSGVINFLSSLGGAIVNALSNITSGIGDVLGTADFGSLIDVFNSTMLSGLIISAKNWFESLTGSVKESSYGLMDMIKDTFGDVSENVTGTLDAVRGSLETWQTNIKTDILLKIAAAVAILVASITVLASIDPDRLTDALGALTVLFGELLGSMTLFTKLNTNMEQLTGIATMIAMAAAISILAGSVKKLADLNPDQIQNGVLAIAGLATVMTVVSKALSTGGDIAKGAIQLVLMAAAIRLIATAVDDLGYLSTDVLIKGISAIGALMLEMAGFSRLVKSSGMISAALSIIIMSGALSILEGTVESFGTMPLTTIAQGLMAVGAAMGELAIFTRLLPKVGTMFTAALGILAISIAMDRFVPVFEKLSAISPDRMISSVIGIAAVFSTLTNYLDPLLKLDLGKIGILAWALPSLTGVLNTAADALTKLGGMDFKSMILSIVMFQVVFDILEDMIQELDKIEIGDMAAMTVALPLLAGTLNTVADAMVKLSGIGIENAIGSIIAIGGAMSSLQIGLDAVQGRSASAITLTLLAGALIVLASAIMLISSAGIVGVAVSLVALAGTLTVVGVATKILKPLIPSMFKFATSLIALGGSLAVLGAGSFVLGLGLVSMLTGLTGALIAISGIDPAKAATGLVVLAGAFTTIYVAAKLLKPMLPSILSLSASIISLGLSCMAVSLGITVLIAGLTALGSVGKENAEMMVETLKSLVVGIAEAIPEIITSLMESFKTILLGALGVLTEIAPEIADSLFKVLMATMESSLEYLPQMADFLIDFLIQMLNTVTSRLGELIPAISGLVGGIITEIQKALSGWTESGQAIEIGVAVLGGLAGLIVAFNLIKGMIPGAMAGAAGVAAFAIEVGAIIAALGALQQATGVSEFINSGGDLLQSLGTAIGQFIGGFVGGVLEGATSTLPQVATSLSQFMMNLTPFIAGAQMINPSIVESVGSLAACILALTGANVVEAIGSFLSGGRSLGEFAQQLIPFGEAVVQFSNVVSGINTEAVTAAATAGQALASLAANLPKEGGLAQAIFGESTDLDEFGAQLVAFGLAIKAYSIAVAGMDTESVVASAQAGQALSDLAQSLPKDGGLAQAIFGESTDLDEFGAQLVSFGLGLKLYAAMVAGLDVGSIQNSVAAGQALSDLSNSLGDKDSVFGWLAGGNKQDLSGFSEQLTTFGQAMIDFGGKISQVDFGAITTATNRVNTIVQLMKNAVDLDTTGVENIKKMTDIGQALSDYYWKISSVDQGLMANSINNLNSLKSFMGGLVGFDTSGVTSFTSAVQQLGQISLDSLVAVFQEASLSDAGTNLMGTLATGIQNGQSAPNGALQIIVDGMKTYIAQKDIDFQSTGSNSITAYASGISNSTSAVSNAVSAVVNAAVSGLGNHYQTFYDTGANLARGFSNGIRDSAYLSRIEAAAMANAAATAAQQALNEHSPSRVMARIGEFAGMGFANGFKPFVEVAGGIGNKMGTSAVDGVRMAVAAINTLDDDFTIKPRIVPVIDTKAMSDSARILNQGFKTSSAVVAQIDGINARIVDAQMAKYPQSQNGVNTGANVTLNQYNYSPKALSSIDIYRQTRNQLSRLKNGGLK